MDKLSKIAEVIVSHPAARHFDTYIIKDAVAALKEHAEWGDDEMGLSLWSKTARVELCIYVNPEEEISTSITTGAGATTFTIKRAVEMLKAGIEISELASAISAIK